MSRKEVSLRAAMDERQWSVKLCDANDGGWMPLRIAEGGASVIGATTRWRMEHQRSAILHAATAVGQNVGDKVETKSGGVD